MGRTVEITLLGVDLLSRAMTQSAKAAGKLQTGLENLSKVGKGAGIAAAAGQISALGVAAAPAAAAILALPAAMASLQVASATVKVGVAGVGDAMKAVAEGDAVKMEKALKKLSPSAREFVKSTTGLKKAFEPVQKAVQQSLFAGLGAQMKSVGTGLLPTVQKGMVQVATALNGIAREALKFAGSPLFKKGLAQVFQGTADAANILKGAVGPLLTVLLKLSTAGQPLVNRFLQFIKVQSTAAAKFLSSAKGAKSMSDTIKKAGDTVAQLGRIVANIGKALYNIFKNGDEGATGLLDTLEKLTKKFAEWSTSVEGQEKSAEFFKTLNDLAKAVTQTLVIVGGALGVVYGLFQKLPEPLKSTVIYFLAFSVVLAPLAAKLMSVFKAVGLLGTGLMKLKGYFTAASGGVSPFSAHMTALKNRLNAARAAITAKIAAMRAWAASMLTATKAALRAAAAQVRLAATTAITTARTVASAVAMKAVAVATRLWAAATWLVNAAMRANPIILIVTLLVALGVAVVLMYKRFAWFRKIVDAVWAGIKTAIKAAWEKVIKPIWAGIKWYISNVLVPIFKMWLAYVKFVWKVISTVIKAAWNSLIKPIWDKIRNHIVTVLIPIFKRLLADGKAIFNKLGSAIRAVWNNVVKPAFNFMKKGVDGVKAAFRTGVNAIKGTWEKLKDILRKPVSVFVNTVYTNGIRKVWSAVRKLVPALPDLPSVRFADGGVVPGGYKPGRDTVLAMMSPGEGVLRPEATRAIGADRLKQINAAAKSGGSARVSRMLGLYPEGGDAAGIGTRGIAGYADGGIIGKIKGALKKPIDWAKNAGSNIMKFGVEKFSNGIIDPIINRLPKGEGLWGNALFGIPKRALEGFKNFIKTTLAPGLGVGGPGMAGALQWARAQAGKPYIWGGAGPTGYDCSGFMGAIVNKIRGRSPYSRLFSTHGFTGSVGPAGFVRNLNSGFKVGITHGGVGHMAGTLNGVNVESSGSAGVRVGGGARGYNNSLFSTWYGLKADTGRLSLQPGWNPPVYNGTGRPELLMTPGQYGQGGGIHVHNHGVIGSQAELDRWMTSSLERLRRRNKLPSAR